MGFKLSIAIVVMGYLSTCKNDPPKSNSIAATKKPKQSESELLATDNNCLSLTSLEPLPGVDPSELTLKEIKKEDTLVGAFKKARIVIDPKQGNPIPDTYYYEACSMDGNNCVHATTITGVDYNPKLPKGPIKLKAMACVFTDRAKVKNPNSRITLSKGTVIYCGEPKTTFANQDTNEEQTKLDKYLSVQYAH